MYQIHNNYYNSILVNIDGVRISITNPKPDLQRFRIAAGAFLLKDNICF